MMSGNGNFIDDSFFPKHYAGRYRVLTRLSRGNPVLVFLADDLLLERKVVIRACATKPFVDWMLNEIRLQARHQYACLVPIYDVAECEDGGWFVVSKYCQGGDLHTRLREDRNLEIRDAALVTAQIAESLQELHNDGIIHRDVKPSNILFDGGQALLDGLLYIEERDGKMIAGTPAFMGPEVWRFGIKASDNRSDIFSLGITFYACLTGEMPFQGETVAEIRHSVIEQSSLPPRKLRRSIPKAIEAICLKAMQKKPEDRFQSAGELAGRLRQFLHRKGLPC